MSYDVEYVGDYFPYGKTIREYVSGEQEKFLTTHHERDEETRLDYRGARFYDADIGRFLSLDPAAVEYPAWSDYNYVLGNPVILVDPDGRTVEVTDLVKGKTEADKKLLNELMSNLSEITGNEISVYTNENGSSFLVEGACKGECKSNSAASYISHLINDKSDKVRVFNNDRNPYVDKKGKPLKDKGSQAYPNGIMFLDEHQINTFQKSLASAGLDDRTINTGMVFLHEALHTEFGASYYRDDGKHYVDPPSGFSSSHKTGDVVDKVNVFRREMYLNERGAYTGHSPSSLRFIVKGVSVDIPIKYN